MAGGAVRSRGQLERDLAKLLPRRQPRQRRWAVGEGKHAIQDGAQLSRGEHARDLPVVGVAPHGRAEQAPLMPEEPAHVQRDLPPPPGAPAHEPPPPPARSQRLPPPPLAPPAAP